MVLDSAGNVGIGTTAPAYPLHVVTSNNSTVLGLDAGSTARFRFAGNSTSGYTSTFNIDDIGLDIGHDSTARSLNLKTGNQDRLTILGTGNVGIGTTAPAAKLHVDSGTDSISMRLKTNNVLNYILLNNSTSANNYLQTNNRTIALSADENGVDGKVFLKTSNQSRVTVNGIGDVGVGTTAPNSKLHISGTAMQQLRMETAGGPSSAGDTSGRNWRYGIR